MGSSQRRGASALATALALLALACAPRVARCAPGASALTPAARAAASPASGPAPAAVVHDGHQLSEALPLLAAPGPPIIIQIADNISWADVAAPRPVVVARDVTLRGVGVPEATEINLHGQYNAWRLEPGASLTLQNLTFSNLAVRPPSADPPPPTNASVFTFPLWFFQTDRCTRRGGAGSGAGGGVVSAAGRRAPVAGRSRGRRRGRGGGALRVAAASWHAALWRRRGPWARGRRRPPVQQCPRQPTAMRDAAGAHACGGRAAASCRPLTRNGRQPIGPDLDPPNPARRRARARSGPRSS